MHQQRNVSTAGASPRQASPNQALGCDQQGCPYQPTYFFSNDNGIKHGVYTNPEHETQSLPISNKAALYKNNALSFFYPAVTAATKTPLPHPLSSIQHISVNNFNNDSRAVGICPQSPVNTLDTPLMPFCHRHLQI